MMKTLRRYFIAGLATLFPIAVTVYLIIGVFRIADGFLGRQLGLKIPGLGLALTIILILIVGVLSSHVFGQIVIPAIERWFNRLPVVKRIYPAVKQLAQFLFSDIQRGAVFQRVVLVQYPRQGAYSIAFVTNESMKVDTESSPMLTLLIPQPPSPFTGPIIFVPRQDVVALDMSIEDALKLVVSGGVVASLVRIQKLPISLPVVPDEHT